MSAPNTKVVPIKPEPTDAEIARRCRALGHPDRIRILRLLADKPMTAKQLADTLDAEPAKTSYHVKQLAKAGLCRLSHTNVTQNGIVEKYYAIACDLSELLR